MSTTRAAPPVAEDANAGAAVAREALRQRTLLAALAGADIEADAGMAQSGARAVHGLVAYRANASMVAERALGAAFPTVRTMIGAADFGHLVRRHWHADPPARGDLGEWGAGFPAWLDLQAELAEWPYLGDCARLDLALHQCERAADAAFDAASLGLLQSGAPERLQLQLMPGTCVLASVWPIATIHAAHRAPEPDFAPVRAALAARRGERVLVARAGWRGVVHPVDDATYAWTCALLDGADLGRALSHARAGFDFTAWLAAALRLGWLQGVASLDG